MKAGMTLKDLAKELKRQQKSKKDYIADTRKLSLKADPSAGILLEGINGGMPLRPTAHMQLANSLAIPKIYYDRMLQQAPELLALNANRWLEKGDKRLVRILDGQVRAILSDSYRPLDNADLAEAVLPKLADLKATVMSADITESRFYVKAVTERIQAEPVQGQVIQAGVSISNSEVGLGSLRVEILDYVLACLNGMIREQAIRKAHLGRNTGRGYDMIEDAREFYRNETRAADDRAFFLKVRDTTEAMFDQSRFNQRMNQYREAAGLPIEGDPAKVVKLASNRFSLLESEGSSVLKHLIAGGDLSQWGLANAVTRAAQDVESYDRSQEMEAIGGRVIELAPTEWKVLAGRRGKKQLFV